jgi:hypothetical protein
MCFYCGTKFSNAEDRFVHEGSDTVTVSMQLISSFAHLVIPFVTLLFNKFANIIVIVLFRTVYRKLVLLLLQYLAKHKRREKTAYPNGINNIS